jgi:DNA repair protein RecN (Recombination protein N)
VITGETGTGKSTLLTAIHLLLGERADPSLIRHGKTKGIVEATFSTISSPLLDDLGIEEDTIILRRELFSTGKSRAFINDHLVSLSSLKQLSSSLIEISDQHAGLTLKQSSTPLQLLDQFAKVPTSDFSSCFGELKALQEQKGDLLQQEPLRQTEIEQIKHQIDEIAASNILGVDDTALFTRLQTIEEQKELYETGLILLSQLDGPLLSQLVKAAKNAHVFVDASEHLEQASKHLSEAINEINRTLATITICEDEYTVIEAQLQKIDKLHRLYGGKSIESVQSSLQERLQTLLNDEITLFEIEEALAQKQKECNEKAFQLSRSRTQAALLFSKEIQKILPDLNMPHALFEIKVSKKERCLTGDDLITFFLTPNPGEKRIQLHEHASGGELARLFLAIQTVLAEQSAIPTILFDEIDASIGGITANFVGKMLSLMGQKRQVLAITHFVQVASQATLHFSLQKKTTKGRTLTTVQKLTSQKEREEEERRMVGAVENNP